jgi:hypothetical protein
MTDRVAILFALWLLVGATRPALADSPVSAPDSAWTAGSALLRAPAAAVDTVANLAPSVSDGAPSPAEIVTMRERVDHPVVRLFIGQDAYDVRRARFDSGGVAFASGNLRGVPAWENGGPNGDHTRPAPLASPIGWDRIDRITMRKPWALRGAVQGGLIGAAVFFAVLKLGSHFAVDDYVNESAGILLIALPPIAALTGGAIGASRWRSQSVWQRAGAGSVGPDAGSTAPLRR